MKDSTRSHMLHACALEQPYMVFSYIAHITELNKQTKKIDFICIIKEFSSSCTYKNWGKYHVLNQFLTSDQFKDIENISAVKSNLHPYELTNIVKLHDKENSIGMTQNYHAHHLCSTRLRSNGENSHDFFPTNLQTTYKLIGLANTIYMICIF